MRTVTGYALTVLGGSAGLMSVHGAVGAVSFAIREPDMAVLGMLLFVAGTVLAWLAAGIGIWAALRLGRQPHAGRTAVISVLLLMLVGLAGSVLLSVAATVIASDALLIASGYAAAVLAFVAARWLATSPRLVRSDPTVG